jgi:hypothetical protein
LFPNFAEELLIQISQNLNLTPSSTRPDLLENQMKLDTLELLSIPQVVKQNSATTAHEHFSTLKNNNFMSFNENDDFSPPGS